jgi:single-strand DNA-binding protein
MIRAEVQGNVGKTPESRQTKAGKTMVRFGVASTKKVEGRDPVTSWVNVIAFDEMADQIVQNVKQGDRVLVTGRLEVETYQDKDGVERTSVTLLADDIGVSLRWGKKPARQTADRGDAWEGGF